MIAQILCIAVLGANPLLPRTPRAPVKLEYHGGSWEPS